VTWTHCRLVPPAAASGDRGRVTEGQTAMGVNAAGTLGGGVAGRAPKTREPRRRRRRGVGSGEGLCPFPENLRIFHLKMVSYGAFRVCYFSDSCVPWIVVV